MYADLHLHSTASDGVCSPAEVVKKAKDLGFKTIALTDHDTVAGLNEALQAGDKLGVEVIAGVELSAIDESGEQEREVHILGYFIDPLNEKLKEVLARIVEDRENRAIKMVEKLNQLGLGIDLNRVREIAGSKYLGRPHVARAMIEKGYISEKSEAFTTDYIGRGGRAYVERFKISPQEGVKLIKQAGGVAVLAHPGYLSDRTALAEEDIIKYKELGLQGVEVFYSRHREEQVEYYKRISEKLGLLITGGSDCHGGEEPLLGVVMLPWEYVDALKGAHF